MAERSSKRRRGGLADSTGTLKINHISNEEWESWVLELVKRRPEATKVSVIDNSPCQVFKTTRDGRFKVTRGGPLKGKQMYPYHIQARLDHPEEIKLVPQVKSATCKVVSHLCGIRNCAAPGHTVIEPKSINDERTHCHFVAHRIIFGRQQAHLWNQKAKQFVQTCMNYACPHEPKCLQVGASAGDGFSLDSPNSDEWRNGFNEGWEMYKAALTLQEEKEAE